MSGNRREKRSAQTEVMKELCVKREEVALGGQTV